MTLTVVETSTAAMDYLTDEMGLDERAATEHQPDELLGVLAVMRDRADLYEPEFRQINGQNTKALRDALDALAEERARDLIDDGERE